MKTFASYNKEGFIKQIAGGMEAPDIKDLITIEVSNEVTANTHYILNGKPKKYSDTEMSLKSARPARGMVWSNKTMSWEDTRSLLEAKDDKWRAIKLLRDEAEFADFTYNGMTFDGDADAQRRLAGYISVSKGAIATGNSFEAYFTLANNQTVLLTAGDFVEIELAKIQAVAVAFSHAIGLRTQIEETTSIDQLDLLNWNL